ncbi:hypothetical protein SN811_05920 [Ligilactobacillus agilis]|uniref:HTH cro/C1-type domain-containing protein n=1 Tax=Ligilactobacillus agilis TaxID=1601 RepID=A0A6F9Y3N0_9LACO|nr:helix-turn-helix transcriptional regulator [Ligilactobacillus agilis]GET12092.1 hypothetical protein SN811_05920 [Ligilactobacillus agilis]
MNRLKELRKQKGLTLVELGKEVNLANNTLRRYERGIREPNISMLIKLADYFNVTVDYLIGREPKNEVIKSYRYYTINENYALKELGVTAPTSEIPILDESEFEALKYSLESNDRLSDVLYDLCRLYYVDKISDDSFEKLTRILVNKKRFLVEVIERVDSK